MSQQRQMMVDMNEERRTLALERAEVSAAQRGMMNKEKQKHDSFTKVCRTDFSNYWIYHPFEFSRAILKSEYLQ